MEETRGWGGWVGFEGERVGVACGMKRMRQIMITKKKKEKHLHFNLKAEGGLIFFSLSLSPFFCPCSLYYICFWDFKISFLLHTISHYFNVTTHAFKLFLVLSVCICKWQYMRVCGFVCVWIHHQPLGHAALPSQNKPHLLLHNKSFFSMSWSQLRHPLVHYNII